MDLHLTDKIAVVTGANKGIGLAITEALVAEGALVVAGSRATENLEGRDGISAVSVDLLSEDGPAQLVQRAIDGYGRLDVLVNNVGGVRIRVDGFLATSDEEFEWALQMNFFTALRAIRAALPAMIEQGSGSIVNVASVNSFFQPDPATIDYGAAKAAVVNLSQSLSQEFGSMGIRVNCVSPGQVSTDLWLGEHGVAATLADATGVDADTVRTAAAAGIATGRFSTPQEVAGVGCDARIRSHRQRHGRQLRHRRRPHQDHLTLATGGATIGHRPFAPLRGGTSEPATTPASGGETRLRSR